MVRAPCCEKKGLKKGPWTPDEDQILIKHIQEHGHSNWRALPKHAGLLRCGKSCRLRWTNYLRPDIKRGNFTREEEDTIIKMHEMLGNRWSTIAAKLPGRTDNEIKNVWHTYLKKRLETYAVPEKKRRVKGVKTSKSKQKLTLEHNTTNWMPISPSQHCSSDISSVTTGEDKFNNMLMKAESSDELPEVDENFWSEVLSVDNSSSEGVIPVSAHDPQAQIPLSLLEDDKELVQCHFDLDWQEGRDFWYNLFTKADEEALEISKM